MGLAASFFFVGALFVANAAFNNLGHPLLSTGFNWARATMGTIPFAWWGSKYGPVEVLAGQAAGSAIFGTLAIVVAFRLTARLGREPSNEAADLATASSMQVGAEAAAQPGSVPVPPGASAGAMAPLVGTIKD